MCIRDRYKIAMQKCDPYLNVDPGTMSPFQHGEVFVTDDGAETDLDIGHYERFTDENCFRDCSITSGKIYHSVITKARRGDYLGGSFLLYTSLGLSAFIFDTAGGVLFAKFLNLFTKKKVNPMIGAAGISAFPMASRVVHKMGREEDPNNFLLMHAAGANVAGQIASVIAGGLLINLVTSGIFG